MVHIQCPLPDPVLHYLFLRYWNRFRNEQDVAYVAALNNAFCDAMVLFFIFPYFYLSSVPFWSPF